MTRRLLGLLVAASVGCSGSRGIGLEPPPDPVDPSLLAIRGVEVEAVELEVTTEEVALSGRDCATSTYVVASSTNPERRAIFAHAWRNGAAMRLDELYTPVCWTDDLGVWWMLRGGSATVVEVNDEQLLGLGPLV